VVLFPKLHNNWENNLLLPLKKPQDPLESKMKIQTLPGDIKTKRFLYISEHLEDTDFGELFSACS
jgi:hypothetical protein